MTRHNYEIVRQLVLLHTGGMTTTTFRPYERRDLDRIPQLEALSAEDRHAMKVVSAVLPFRTNAYVVDELIDWSRVPDDPMFRLTFPHRDMLLPADFDRMSRLIADGAPDAAVKSAARAIQHGLNPHPAGQTTLNVPMLDGHPVAGMQHKYPETVLFFPQQGQTCHAYCTYCFRWPQFVGLEDLKFASREVDQLIAYLRVHPEVTSVLFTGGDPMIMRASILARYLEPLAAADLPNLVSIRIGTKAPAYWPQRFVTDNDADEVLRLFEKVNASGKTLALMAHYTHPRELETDMARRAVERIRATGAVVRCQSPMVRHVNDDADSWARMWSMQVRLGAVPYYMFVERDTGPAGYFEVPLVKAHEIYRDAVSRVSGLARTVRGPSMSATPGKVVVDGTATVNGTDVMVLRFLQARDPAWVGRPFFAKRDDRAAWLTQLRPAFEPEFFYEAQLRAMTKSRSLPVVANDAVTVAA